MCFEGHHHSKWKKKKSFHFLNWFNYSVNATTNISCTKIHKYKAYQKILEEKFTVCQHIKLFQMTFINMYLLTFKIGLTFSWSDVVSLFLHLVTSHPHSLLQTLSFFLQEQSRLLQFVLHLQIIVDVLTFCSKTENSSQFYDGKFDVNNPVNAELFGGWVIQSWNFQVHNKHMHNYLLSSCTTSYEHKLDSDILKPFLF